jgi:tetratricopeptide (TPR) repeat protein
MELHFNRRTNIMNLSQISANIQERIAQGDLEAALQDLVNLLAQEPRWRELAQAARVNQADFFQLKSQTIKGTIAADEARIVTNKITDSVLQILRQAESGTTAPAEREAPRQVWRYYLAGGIVALAVALAAWQFLGGETSSGGCPTYGDVVRFRVMILPFKQIGDKKSGEPALEIMVGLNKLIEKTKGLQGLAEADVKENHDINKDYPKPSDAAQIAEDCQVQLIVWGNVNQSNEQSYKMDVQYKLIDAAGSTVASGDTSLSNLLKIKEEGQQLSRDVEAVTNLLYVVLLNKAGLRVTSDIMAMLTPKHITALGTAEAADSLSDHSVLLAVADNYSNTRRETEAIQVYDQVLEADPNNQEARQKRGALLYKRGDYPAAARDLEMVQTDPQKQSTALQKTRVEAYLKSGQPDKAERDLQQIQRRKDGAAMEGTWLRNKTEEAAAAKTAMQQNLKTLETGIAAKPQDATKRISAARTSFNIGEHDKALRYANDALQQNPKNEEAVEIAVKAQIEKGDTLAAVRTLRSAERAGVNVKGIIQKVPSIRTLSFEKAQRN